jgi:hypothetical protein
MIRTLATLTLACTVALTVANCGGDDSNIIGPSNQPEVTNATDNFQFQATNLIRVRQVLTYTWANTGTLANVNQSGTISGGSAILVLRDASGVERYRRSLSDTGTFTSTTGTSGNWTIEVRLDDVTGTLNFRVQKP